MSWVATAIVGGAVVGGGLSYLGSQSQSKAAEKAAKSQQKGADAATQAQLEMYYQSREDLAPWREAGAEDLANLQRIEGTYENVIMDPSQYIKSPSYNFLLDQGVNAINRGSAARGKLDSGQNSKDLMAFGQGLASQDYGNYVGRIENLLNRYAGTAGVGQTATNTSALLGQNTANNVANNALYSGDAQAGQYVNQANATTGLYSNLSNIGSNALNQYILNNYLNPRGGGLQGYQYYGSGGQSAGFK